MSQIDRLRKEQEKAALMGKRIVALQETIAMEFAILDARQERVKRLFELHSLRLKLQMLKDETVQFETKTAAMVDLIPELRQVRGALVSRIVAAAKAVRRESCGVYFLIQGSRVVYVGQSKNVHARIEEHLKFKEFDGACFVKCAEADLFDLERTYISILRPPLNRDASTVIFRERHPDPDLEGD